MKFVALLRGINVGTSKRIEMKALRGIFEDLGYTDVSTYINSGNVEFESEDSSEAIVADVEKALLQRTSEEIRVLVKTKSQMAHIAGSIPPDWTNDDLQRTDVAYLFPEINRQDIIEDLPVKREYVKILFVDGAIIWNVQRHVLHKSQLNKLVGHKLYKSMTVRNVNTARYLARER